MRIKSVIFSMTLLFSLIMHTNLNAQQFSEKKPVVYSYWAGWSNEQIPDIKFDGLFLAFAQLRPGSQSHYYTDYLASGNFQIPSNQGAYTMWSSWWLKYWNQGGRAYVSYGGGTNGEFGEIVLNATDQQLDQIAGEIKANITQYNFDGVDLDIENWWS